MGTVKTMNEKIIAKGKVSKANIPAIVCGVLAIFLLFYSIWWTKNVEHTIAEGLEYGYFNPFLYGRIPLILVGILLWVMLSNCEIVVTDKRVYGKSSFGHQVNLPFDMISSAGSGIFSSIAVATSSGKIVFWYISNRQEILNAIIELLNERQGKPETATIVQQVVPTDNADELKKYKELLDSGIISQEEFDLKKKQLLNL